MRILKIKSLSSAKKWVDKDEFMLHACFQLLEDAVNIEHVDIHCNYECHKQFVDTVRFLYEWWQIRKLKIADSEQQMEEDDEMLMKLMKIRTSLWT